MPTDSRKEGGAALIEYISIIVMIAIVSIFSIQAYSQQTSGNYQELAFNISNVILPQGGGTEGTIHQQEPPEAIKKKTKGSGQAIPSTVPAPAVAGLEFF